MLLISLTGHIEKFADLRLAYQEKLMDLLRDDAPHIVGILLVAFIFWQIIRSITARLAEFTRRESLRGRVRAQQLRTLSSVVRSGGTFLVSFIAALQILEIFHINIAPLLASAGVAGLAIGFGAQTLVKDIITGFFILFENQFDIGDTVKVAGVSGTVEEVRLRSTVLRDGDGTQHLVPNSQISIVSNLTRDWNLLTLHVAVDYNESSDRVIQLLKEVAEDFRNDPDFMDDLVSEIEVPGIERVSGSEVDYLVSAKVRPGKQARVSRELRRRIKTCLEENQVKAGGPAMVYFGTPTPGNSTGTH
jgi:small-conductance mechanosensitive channel